MSSRRGRRLGAAAHSDRGGRALRRQAMRAAGYRGSKSHDNVKPDHETVEAQVQQLLVNDAVRRAQADAQKRADEHERRQNLRRMGVVVPPSEAEAQRLRELGASGAGAGGLLLPS